MDEGSLYTLLGRRYELHAAAAESVIAVGPITIEEAGLLAIRGPRLALVERAIVRDRDGRVMEYLVSINHPQLVAYASQA